MHHKETMLHFSKYTACGNDFVLIDNRTKMFPKADKQLISKLCHPQHGIGADGVILLDDCSDADLHMHVYNADGSEPEMCGNGVRCLVNFAKDLGINKPQYSIQTKHKCVTATYVGDKISVDMGLPQDLNWHIPVNIDDNTLNVHHLDTGVPHLVWFCDSPDSVDLAVLGPQLRYHNLFAPRGANVNVASINPTGEIYNRSYERGLERETLACGTGCVAVALAAAKLYDCPSPITVQTRGGPLEISFSWRQGALVDVVMTGTSSLIYSGQITI